MRRIDEKEILRRTELLSKIEPTQESIDRAITRVRQALVEHKFETTGVWRTIMTSRWTKLAAAAVIIAGVLIGIKVLSGEQNAEQNIAKEEETPKQEVIQDSGGEKAEQREVKVAMELAQAEALYRAGDVAGLVATLETGEPQTKAAVANYLAEIGDVSALEALIRLSDQWEGEDAENPFATAVRRIEERISPEAAGYEAQPEEQLQGEWMEVHVIAKETGEPVPFADIRTYHNGSAYYETDANGILVLEFGDKRPDYLNVFTVEPGWVSMSVSLRNDQSLGIPNQFTFALEKGTVIGGVVQDPNGKPMEGVKVSVNVREEMDNEQAKTDVRGQYETDAGGRWRCDIVPAVLDQIILDISCKGYGPRDLWAKDLDMRKLRSEEFVVTLRPGLSLAGYVCDEDGRPVVGARILRGHSHFISASGNWAATDSTGKFKFADIHKSSKEMLTVLTKGYAPQVKEVTVDVNMPPVDFVLEPGYTLKGRVIDSLGNPIADATITVNEWQGYQIIDWQGSTDAQGRFIWEHAPAEQFEIDVRKEGYMEVDDAVVLASDAEYEFVMEEPIRVRGKVVDAETGKPIEKFKVIPGYRRTTPPNVFTSIGWQDNAWTSRMAVGGAYEQTMSWDGEYYGIRIEAEGYMLAESRKIERHEKDVVIDFELEKATGPSGVVKLAGGRSVEGAEVYLVTHFYMENGWVEGKQDMTYVRTDAEGRFAFKPQLGDYKFAVVCDEGFAMVNKEDIVESAEIIIQPWGTVTGDFYIGSRPGVGQKLHLDYPKMMRQSLAYTANNFAVTDANGIFVFKKVIPGEFRVNRKYFEVEPGQTLEIHLGGDGRTVNGRFLAPEGFDGVLEEQYESIRVDRKSPMLWEIEIPRPANLETMSYSQVLAWLTEFAESDEGKRFQAEVQARLGGHGKNHIVSIGEGGAFSIDNVLPGEYAIKGDVWARRGGMSGGPAYEKKVARVYYELTAPEITEGTPIDEPVELGDIQMLPGKLEPGMKAPSFEVDGLKGGKVRLSDYTGRVVLVSFYTTHTIENSDEIENLRRIYQRYGNNRGFVLVGMLGAHPRDYLSAKLVQESKLEWIHGYAEQYDSREHVEYDVGGQPWNVLIGADGKVLAIGVKGEELVAAVEEALRPQ